MKLTRTSLQIFVLASLLIGIATDSLFRQQIFGLNFIIWTYAWIVISLTWAKVKKRASPEFILHTLFGLVSSGLVFVRSEPIVQFWLVTITLVSIGNIFSLIHIQNATALQLTKRWVELVVSYLGSVSLLKVNVTKKVTKPLPWAWLVAVPIISLFIGLFSSSDKVFSSGFTWLADVLEAIGNWLSNFDIGQLVGVSFWVLTSLLALLLLAKNTRKVNEHELALKRFITPKDAMIILCSVAVVFGAYVLIQVVYLFGNVSLPDGITYADYARRGYGELLVATVISCGIVYYLARAVKVRSTLVQQFSVLLLALNTLVVLSAWKRLNLYESAYGWTMTRFVARMGLVCMFIGIILLVLFILDKLSARKLFLANWYVLKLVLITAAILNPVGLITQKNMSELSNREVPLDTYHLLSQSPDSYLAICKYLPQVEISSQKASIDILNREANVVTYDVSEKYYLPIKQKTNQGLSRHWVYTNKYQTQSQSCLKNHSNLIESTGQMPR